MYTYYGGLAILVPLVAGLYIARRKEEMAAAKLHVDAESVKDLSSERTRFKSFQHRYLVVFWLMMAGDWLQGPYMYALYAAYGFSHKDIALLFVAGFGGSAIIGTPVSAAADKYGRRRFGLLYAVMYALSCTMKHSPNFTILLVGRVLGGVATSLLFTVFECWLVCEHERRNFPPAWLGETLSLATSGNAAIAIISGLCAQFAADATVMRPLFSQGIGSPYGVMVGGFCAPFDLAILTLGLGGLLIVSMWTENFGNAGSTHDSNDDLQGPSSLKNDVESPGDDDFACFSMLPSDAFAFKLCKRLGIVAAILNIKRAICTITDKPSVAKLAAVCSLFEGAMFAFVFEWTPALEHSTANAAAVDGAEPAPIPFGVVFAAFMVACAGGSEAFALVMGRRDRAVALAAASHTAATAVPSNIHEGSLSAAASPMNDVKGRSKSGSFDSDVHIGSRAGLFNSKSRSDASGEEVESGNSKNSISAPGHFSEAFILYLVCSVGAVSLFLPALLTASPATTFMCFLVFEFCIGAYFPASGTLKSQLVPADTRASTYALFRLPLNILVLFVLLFHFSDQLTHIWCATLLTLAAYIMNSLIKSL